MLADHWNGGVVDPRGFNQIERFRLEGATPLWTYGFADALLDKRIWMQPGANTTYVRYDLRRASRPVTLHIKALVNYRDHHASTRPGDWRMEVSPMENGLAYHGLLI